jgi:hypothetical protein
VHCCFSDAAAESGKNKFTERRSLEEVMKNKSLMVAVAFSFLILLTPAFAQTQKIKVDVPFAFEVGKKSFTAGEYVISNLEPTFLRIQRTDGPDSTMVLSSNLLNGPEQDKRTRLVFHRYSEHYFLAEVWIGSGQSGHQLFASASEVQLARAERQSQRTLLATKEQGK